MATLQKIRNRAGLLVAVVGIALFAFIIGDFLNSGSTFFHQSKEKVATVEGETIGIEDFQMKINELEEIYKMNTNSSSLPEEMQSQIRQEVYDRMVRNIVMQKEAAKLGLAVSKEELADIVMGENISPVIMQMPQFRNSQTGAFDRNLLVQFLQTLESDNSNLPLQAQMEIEGYRRFWYFFEQSLKDQKYEEKYSNLLAKSVVANSIDSRASFDAGHVSVDFDYVAQPYSQIPDDQVNVTNAEIEKLYNRKKESFKQPEAVVIDYIAVDIIPSSSDYQEIENLMNKVKPEFADAVNVSEIVNENSDVPYSDIYTSAAFLTPDVRDFVQNSEIGAVEGPVLVGNTYHLRKLMDITSAPDSVYFFQLMLPQLEESDLKALADSLINEINSGKSFAELALEGTGGQTTGEVGWRTESQIVTLFDERFKNGVFNGPLNTPYTIESNYGTHLALVTEKTSPVRKYKLADISIEVSPSSDTFKKLYNDLTQYVSQNKNAEDFRTKASEAGYFINTNIHVGKNDETIGTLSSVRPLVRWAYDNKKGAISEIFELKDKFVVATVKDYHKEGYRPLASVSEVLRRELMNEKKAEKIIADLKDKKFGTLEEYADVMNSGVQSVKFVNFATNSLSGIGIDPYLTALAPLSEVAKISEPIRGENAVYVIKVTEKRENEGEYDPETQKQMAAMTNMYRFMYQAIPTLIEESDVQDYRIRFY